MTCIIYKFTLEYIYSYWLWGLCPIPAYCHLISEVYLSRKELSRSSTRTNTRPRVIQFLLFCDCLCTEVYMHHRSWYATPNQLVPTCVQMCIFVCYTMVMITIAKLRPFTTFNHHNKLYLAIRYVTVWLLLLLNVS